jgi:hypothetical protein
LRFFRTAVTMANYNGRRAPNVSQYIRTLNVVSPEGQDDEMSPMDLSLFTNTEFYDLESGRNTDYQAQPLKIDTAAPTPAASTVDESSLSSAIGEVSSLEFLSGDYNFDDNHFYQASSVNTFAGGPHNFQPLQPSHGAVFPGHGHVASQQLPQFQQSAARAGDKRKSDDLSSASQTPLSMEEQSRASAEEDKRRRNTAASARFRVKKKQREQALEKSAKEMTERVTSLESKVSQLETENKWLKNLLVDKNGGNEDITNLWKEFTKHAAQQRAKADTTSKSDR